MKQKCTKNIYTEALIAAQGDYTATGIADAYAGSSSELAHDSVTRWQKGVKLTPARLWPEVEPMVEKKSGYLVVDDITIEKSRSYKLPISSWHWSGSAHDIVRGLNVVNLLWTNNDDHHIPVDFRLYAKGDDGMTRNQHMQAMLRIAHHRGFKPEAVVFDTWYTSKANLNLVQDLGWVWFAPLRKNRVVNYTEKLEALEFTDQELQTGKQVHLKLVGPVKVFKFIAKNGDIEYWATNKLDADTEEANSVRRRRWNIEQLHRGLKQTTGIGKSQSRSSRAQRNHVFCSIRAFIILEQHRITTGTSWYEAKRSIIREAIRGYLREPQTKRIAWPESMG